MARVAEHLSIAELEERFRTAKDPILARHVQVIWLLAQGHTSAEVSTVTSFVPRWIEQLRARYNAEGFAALGDLRRHNGRAPSLLKPDLLERLRVRLADPPPDGGLWTSGKVARWMAGELGLASVCVQRGWEALRAIEWSIQKPRPRHPKAATPEEESTFKKKLDEVVAEEAARRPDLPVEVFATDEHRLGLKPVLRRVWAPKGERPIALGHHRYKWLYVTAFTQPLSGETIWYLSTGVSKAFFAALLAAFAEESAAGRERSIVLVLDQAGWHTEPNLRVPDGIRLFHLPSYTPELQPAERLWPVLDEPVVNTYFATLADLEAVIAQRCIELDSQDLRTGTNFHWWPKPVQPK